MILRLLIGAAVLAAAPVWAQEKPDPDAPTATARSIDVKAPPETPEAPQAKAVQATPAAAQAADANADGGPLHPQQLFISPMGEPFRAAPGAPYPVVQWFNQADTSGKGYITLEDFKADAMRFFKVLDENGDGIVDGFEAQDYEAKIAPEILPRVADVLTARDVMTQRELAKSGQRARKPQDSIGAGLGKGSRSAAARDVMSGAAIYGLLPDPEPVRSADAKLDYHITKEEWLEAAVRRFNELDKDHTGKLVLSKLPMTPLQKAIEDSKKHDKRGEHAKGEREKADRDAHAER
jgi:hypothetical protein